MVYGHEDEEDCPAEHGDHVYSVVLQCSFYVYMLSSLIMILVLILVLKKRGNCIAI